MTIALNTYNLYWKSIYSEEKEKIQLILGDLLLHIEHIGSTSVEQLYAKPIIDMAAGVRSLEQARDHKEAFARIGYELAEHKEFPQQGRVIFTFANMKMNTGTISLPLETSIAITRKSGQNTRL